MKPLPGNYCCVEGKPRSYIMCYGKQHLNAEGKNMKNDFLNMRISFVDEF